MKFSQFLNEAIGAELKIAINLDDLGTDKEDKDRVLKGIKDGVKYYEGVKFLKRNTKADYKDLAAFSGPKDQLKKFVDDYEGSSSVDELAKLYKENF